MQALQVDSDDGSDTIASLEVCAVTGKSGSDAIWVAPTVNGVKLRMKLDTGSAFSILPLGEFRRFFKNTQLGKTAVRLKTYTGETLSPVGVMKANVSYKGQQAK